MDRTIHVLIAHEHSLFREALRAALDADPHIDVVGQVKDGSQAIAQAVRTRPDIALLDAGLPNCDGVRATSIIAEQVPECRMIVLGDPEDEHLLLSAIEAGAHGFITRERPLTELIEATKAVATGQMVIPPTLLPSLITSLVSAGKLRASARRRAARLTPREKQVLALVTDGASNDRIAQALIISPQTARTHVHNILDKLGARSRLEAAAFVRQNRIMDELVAETR